MAVDAVISEEIRIGCDRAEVVDHTISTFSQRVSCKARRTNRPMRPKPLMATRTPIDFHADIAALGNLAP